MIVLLVLGILLKSYQALDIFDRIAYDTTIRQSVEPADSRIVLVEIDDKSIAHYGQWPWARSKHAELINRLNAAKPQGIMVDILFVEPSEQTVQDDALANAIGNGRNIVLPILLSSRSTQPLDMEEPDSINVVEPIESIKRRALIGYSTTNPDIDNTIRSVGLSMTIQQRTYPLISALLIGQASSSTKPSKLLIPYAGSMGRFEHYSYADVMEGKVNSEVFKDKYVLVGATATGLDDLHKTPFGLMSGVEIHANLMDGLLNNRRITEGSSETQILFSLLPMFFLMLIFVVSAERHHLGYLILAIVVYGLLCLGLYQRYQVWMQPTVGLLLMMLAYILWGWRRLSAVTRYLRHQLKQITTQIQSGQNMSPSQIDGAQTLSQTMSSLDQLQTKLTQAQAANRELIEYLSHDMRTPQVNILAALSEYERQTDDNTQKQLIQQIRDNAHRTIEFARDIVSLNQVQDGQLHLEEHNIGHLIEYAIEKVHLQAQNKSIRIEQRFSEDHDEWAWAHVDGELIERAIINLLTNAIRYSPTESVVEIQLELKKLEQNCHSIVKLNPSSSDASQSPNCIIIRIIDQGMGMSDQTIDSLTRGVKSTNSVAPQSPVDAAGSMGIGWRMIRSVMRQHYGQVSISSEVGQGTTIVLSIPQSVGNHNQS